jgi:hypothetical protein
MFAYARCSKELLEDLEIVYPNLINVIETIDEDYWSKTVKFRCDQLPEHLQNKQVRFSIQKDRTVTFTEVMSDDV